MVNFLYTLDTFHTVPETKISPENSVVGSWKMKFPLEMVPFQRCFMLIFGGGGVWQGKTGSISRFAQNSFFKPDVESAVTTPPPPPPSLSQPPL